MATEEQTQYDVSLNMVTGIYDKAGQRITIPNREILKLAFPLSKVGSPSGNVIFQIRNVQGGLASSDTILATKTWGLANDLPTSAAWKEVTLDTPITLNQEVRLVVVITGGVYGVAYVKLWKINSNQKSGEWFCWNYSDLWVWSQAGVPESQEGAYKYIYSDDPTVTTQAVTDIALATATGNGNITDLGDGSVSQHGVCWNTSGTPTTADDKTEEGAAGATGAFTSSVTGLTPNTLYYVRAYATSEYGTAYGGEVTFTTLSTGYVQAHLIA